MTDLTRHDAELDPTEDEGRDALADYWIRHCHGFRVDSPRGRVGIVEDVLYGADRDRPAVLAVRGGVLGGRLQLVSIGEVASIDPRRKRLAFGSG